MTKLSHFAWAVLGQLAGGAVWDGDLVCKSGRDELIRAGLAMRLRKNERGLMLNELTMEGARVAAQLSSIAGRA